MIFFSILLMFIFGLISMCFLNFGMCNMNFFLLLFDLNLGNFCGIVVYLLLLIMILEKGR